MTHRYTVTLLIPAAITLASESPAAAVKKAKMLFESKCGVPEEQVTLVSCEEDKDADNDIRPGG